MSSFSTMDLDAAAEYAPKIQDISRAELVTVVCEADGERHFFTFQLLEGGKTRLIASEDDGRIFAGFSQFKVYIAAGLTLMIEKLSVDPATSNVFGGLRNAWNRRFTKVFNEYSEDFKIKKLHGNPTVLQVLIHFKGPHSINHLSLAPEGSFLLSKSAFLNMISQYTEDTSDKDRHTGWSEYSNANYILAALLIEAVSKQSLADFLRQHIFEPLGMHRTYMTSDQLLAAPIESRVRPHVVSSYGKRRAITKPLYMSDTVESAALGGYICAGDMATFFEMVLRGWSNDPVNAKFDRAFVQAFFNGINVLEQDGETNFGHTKFGLLTRLDSHFPGSQSPNRMVSSGSGTSLYKPGKTSQGNDVTAYYIAGSGTGWLSTSYVIPGPKDKKEGKFVIVLSNCSGPVDTSDIVSKLYLQEMLDLRPTKIGDPNFTCQPTGWRTMSLRERCRAHYVWLAEHMFPENAPRYENLEKADRADSTPAAENPGALGIFENEKNGQRLRITSPDGNLVIQLQQGHKESQLMRFVRQDQAFRICSPSLGTMDLIIDCLGGDWDDLTFEFLEKDGIIDSFSRTTRTSPKKLVDHFTRVRKER